MISCGNCPYLDDCDDNYECPFWDDEDDEIIAKGEFKLKYKEIKKYLYGGCIVRNEEYEYKVSKGDNIYCRQIGCETWNSIISIPDYEKEQEWELVGKKK